jgi:hypothetical protein
MKNEKSRSKFLKIAVDEKHYINFHWPDAAAKNATIYIGPLPAAF